MSLMKMLFVPTVGLENIYLIHLLLVPSLVNTHYIYLSLLLYVFNTLTTTLVKSIQKQQLRTNTFELDTTLDVLDMIQIHLLELRNYSMSAQN